MESQIGKPLPRIEDERLLRGEGTFTDDLIFDGQLQAVFVRSPHAHARIARIDLSAAATMPGVKACINGLTLKQSGLKPADPLTRSPNFPVSNADGSQLPDVRRWPLAVNKVRFAGEPVAVVAAASKNLALAAADKVEVEYDPLPAIVTKKDALAPGAALIWDEIGSNICVQAEYGDSKKVDQAFEKACNIISLDVSFPRHIVAYLEPRSVVARFDKTQQKFEVFTGCQSPHWYQKDIAEILDVELNKVRVAAYETGGGFGARTTPSPEVSVTAWLSKFTGLPVKWVPDRSEAFLTDSQSRDHQMRIQLGVDSNGLMTGIRLASDWRLGAYLNPRSVWLYASYMALMLCGTYRIPAAHYLLTGFFSNTAQIGPFRGVARAEVSYAIERVVEETARRLGMSAILLRQKNLIRSSNPPWKAPTGAIYADNDFEANLQLLLNRMEESVWQSSIERKTQTSKKLRGIGHSLFVDSVGGTPSEFAQVQVKEDFVEARVGTKSIGTGHETVYSQVLASQLQLPIEQVRIIDGDTDLIPKGVGTHASRSLRIGGAALYHCTEKVLEGAKTEAANCLEAAVKDIQYVGGNFLIPGTDRHISLFAIAQRLADSGDELNASHEHTVQKQMYSSGCQACEVEVDVETGQVSILRFIAVSDPGNIVNPLIVEGQLHGGIVHGIGHALFEQAFYDSSTGQLLTGSFMDYPIPRADDCTNFDLIWNPIGTDENPLGVKGAGEIGTIGAPAAIVNAVINALEPLGIKHVEMPITSEQIWKLIQRAES